MPDIVCRVVDCHVFFRASDGPLYLLMKRSPDVIYAGSWRMVGGKIEVGEKAVETAVRELYEETGLYPKRLWSVPYINSFYEASRDRVNIIPVFAVEVASQHVRLSAEHDAHAWVTYEVAIQRLPWPAQVEGVRIVHEYVVAGKPVADFVEVNLNELIPPEE